MTRTVSDIHGLDNLLMIAHFMVVKDRLKPNRFLGTYKLMEYWHFEKVAITRGML